MDTMRRILAFDNVSADGYFAASDGNLNWVVSDNEIYKTAVDAMAGADTILFGRRTYELFEGFWPRALHDSSAAPDPHGRGRSPELHAMAVWINEAAKVVFSRSRQDVTWTNSRLLHNVDRREIQVMKRQAGKDMMIFGSSSIVSKLTEHGLIDEYQFVVNPVILGSGQSLLNGVSKQVKLDLLESRKFSLSGNVMLRYAPRTA